MTVQDVIEYVKSSDLANSGLSEDLDSNDPDRVVKAEKTILTYINLGLIELYKRFNLRTEEVIIPLQTNTTIYHINIPTFNFILGVYNEKGEEYELNSENDALSILTPSYNTLQVPNAIEGNALFVVYDASPDKLEWNDDLTCICINLPPVLYEALFKYIGYRVYTGMGKEYLVEMQNHYNMFIKSCNDAKTFGVINEDPLVSSNKLERKGFI